MRKAICLALILMLTPTLSYGHSTPKENQTAVHATDSQSFDDLCAKAAAEVKASRKYIAECEARIELYKQEIAAAKQAESATSESVKIQADRIDLLNSKVKLEEDKIQVQQTKIDLLNKRVDELTRDNKKLRSQRNKLLGVVIVVATIGALFFSSQ